MYRTWVGLMAKASGGMRCARGRVKMVEHFYRRRSRKVNVWLVVQGMMGRREGASEKIPKKPLSTIKNIVFSGFQCRF